MHKSFVETYVCVFMLIIWAAQKSDCKQGGHQSQQINAEDFNFYNGAACLSYGHSCWGAHGKRNADVRNNNPNAWFSYRMALMRKTGNGRDASAAADRNDRRSAALDDEYAPPPNYFNVLKTYMQQRDAEKTNGDNAIGRGMEWNWNIQPNKYMPSARTYYEEQVLDPKIEYKLMKI